MCKKRKIGWREGIEISRNSLNILKFLQQAKMSKLLTQIPVRHFVDEASRQDKDGWTIKTQVFTIRHTDTEQSRDNNKNGFDD